RLRRVRPVARLAAAFGPWLREGERIPHQRFGEGGDRLAGARIVDAGVPGGDDGVGEIGVGGEVGLFLDEGGERRAVAGREQPAAAGGEDRRDKAGQQHGMARQRGHWTSANFINLARMIYRQPQVVFRLRKEGTSLLPRLASLWLTQRRGGGAVYPNCLHLYL